MLVFAGEKLQPKDEMDRTYPLSGLTAVVLGTGGAARALAFGAAERGCTVVVVGRTLEKASVIAEQLDKNFVVMAIACTYELLHSGQVPCVDVLINTTPLGMEGANEGKSPVKKELLEKVCSHFGSLNAK
jgi:shikimate dehydrogenase